MGEIGFGIVNNLQKITNFTLQKHFAFSHLPKCLSIPHVSKDVFIFQ